MGDFPSGQRGQTVNLLASPSVVRIHLPPPRRRSKEIFAPTFFCCAERCICTLFGFSCKTPVHVACLPQTAFPSGLIYGQFLVPPPEGGFFNWPGKDAFAARLQRHRLRRTNALLPCPAKPQRTFAGCRRPLRQAAPGLVERCPENKARRAGEKHPAYRWK